MIGKLYQQLLMRNTNDINHHFLFNSCNILQNHLMTLTHDFFINNCMNWLRLYTAQGNTIYQKLSNYLKPIAFHFCTLQSKILNRKIR